MHGGARTGGSSSYDRTATRALIKAIRAAAPGHVKLIYFNDPVLIREGLTTRYTGHDDHLHIRYCEPGYPVARIAADPAPRASGQRQRLRDVARVQAGLATAEHDVGRSADDRRAHAVTGDRQVGQDSDDARGIHAFDLRVGPVR